jgi:radical SAM protein with 4Fe4S-binding SPASM domain
MRERLEAPPLEYETLSAPFSVQVELTERCKNKCITCYNFYRQSPDYKTLSPSETVSVIEQLGEAGVFSVTFTGGEPLMAPRSLTAGLSECKRWNITPSLNSSLTCGNTETFIDLKRSGLINVLTSIMSCSAEVHDYLAQRKNAFVETVAGIKKAQSAGLNVSVNMVVNKDNLNDVYTTGEFCARELHIHTFCATRVGPSSYNLDWFNTHKLNPDDILIMLNQMLRIEKELGIKVDTLEPLTYCSMADLENYHDFTKRRCSAGVTFCAIGADGGVRPCPHADVNYGYIQQEGFKTAWQGMQQWRDGSLIPEECWDCKFLTRCKAGCRMMGKYAKGTEGNLDDPDLYTSNERSVIRDWVPSEELELPEGFYSLPLSLSSEVKLRLENFGGAVALYGRNPVLVNNFSFTLLQNLKQRKMFMLNEIGDEFGLDQGEIESFFGPLYARNIIIKNES